jgi:hypothetical protein
MAARRENSEGAMSARKGGGNLIVPWSLGKCAAGKPKDKNQDREFSSTQVQAYPASPQLTWMR